MSHTPDIVAQRTGSFDHESRKFETKAESLEYAKKRYDNVITKNKGERIISCSDDNTMFLWNVSSMYWSNFCAGIAATPRLLPPESDAIL